jgi:hypothetical protein
MSRSRPLPSIPVKHVPFRKVLSIAPTLEAKLRAYIAYYTDQQGLDPKQAPSDADTIVALVESYLDRDAGFARYLRNQAPRRTAVAKPKAGPTEPTAA